MTNKSALVIVDLQNDFCTGGPLGAPDTEAIIPVINQLLPHFDLVVASRDWHPVEHGCFASNHPGHKVGDVIKFGSLEQTLWPDHCIQGTPGAEFHSGLHTDNIDKVFLKGTDREIDSLSAFYDNARVHSTGMSEYLHEAGVTDVYIVGLVTEYCVLFSALDAVQEGFNVAVILDGCRGVELNEGDVAASLVTMQKNGIKIIDSSTFLHA